MVLVLEVMVLVFMGLFFFSVPIKTMARKAKSASPKRRARRSKSPKVRRASSKKAKKAVSKKRVANKWIKHVKAQSKKLGITYGAALSDPKVRAAYKA